MFSRIFTFAEVHTHNLVFLGDKKMRILRDTELGNSNFGFWVSAWTWALTKQKGTPNGQVAVSEPRSTMPRNCDNVRI